MNFARPCIAVLLRAGDASLRSPSRWSASRGRRWRSFASTSRRAPSSRCRSPSRPSSARRRSVDELSQNVAQVVTADLKRSGLFAPVDPSAFIEPVVPPTVTPNFANWRPLNAQALVSGSVATTGDGRIMAEYRLWDVVSGQYLVGKQFFASPDNWRRLAHIIADSVYERLTGEKGYFDSRIAFVDETGGKAQRVKRLAIMDQDGANVRYLTDGEDLVVTPRFSPSRQELAYASLTGDNWHIYVLNIETGQRELIGNFPNMAFSPRFSPDGQQVVLSLQQGGNANIYRLDLRTRQLTRLTDFAVDRHRALLFADRHADRVRVGPRRAAADLCDERERRAGAAHQLRLRPLRDAGLVAARRSHRLHQAGGGRASRSASCSPTAPASAS